jgi:succinate-semialdehyde dehydrogenase/glutarate-semialdehyde dehydrogenase
MTDPQLDGLLRQQAFIGGGWVDADDGATLDVTDPATGERLGSVPKMGGAETRRAIDAAQAAWPAWRAKTAQERAGVLRRWFDLIIHHRRALARLLTLEQGKPLAEADSEIGYAAGFIEWFAEEGRRAYGEVTPSHNAAQRIITLKQPIGVVGAITPWNFPAAMVTRKLGPALAAGCPVVLKPASQTPFSALALAALAEEAGLPSGLLNVVTGSAQDIGGELTANPVVRKISFTGSTEIGRQLMRQSADTIKKLSLELGGNAPFIVFDDADLDAAVAGAVTSKFRNSGQTCVCTNRFNVQAGVHDAFVAKLAEATRALRVGAGLDDGVQVGPLIDAPALAKVEEHVADALAKGATILTGGRRHPLGGTYYEPTMLAGITGDMLLTREETFGPVAGVVRFDTEEEAITLANDSEFGLAAYVYARDLGRVWRVAEALEVGIVGVNTGLISTEIAPFGGVKQSGLGREGSRHGLDEYLELKYVCLGL